MAELEALLLEGVRSPSRRWTAESMDEIRRESQCRVEERRLQSAKIELESLLLEGMEGPAQELTPELWDRMFDEAKRRHNNRAVD